MDEVKKDDVKTCYIVGGGPSLTNFDFSLLKSKETIAVNHSLQFCPFATYFLTADSGVIRKAVENKFWGASPTTKKVVVMGPDHKRYNKTKQYLSSYTIQIAPKRYDGVIGFSTPEFATGKCSGFCALQWAVLAGYKRIYLMGIDLVAPQGRRHHYSASSEDKADRCLGTFYEHFSRGIEILKQHNIEVISMSSISRLNQHIPYCSLEELSTQ